MAQGQGGEDEALCVYLFVCLLCIAVFRLAQGRGGEAKALTVYLFISLLVCLVKQCTIWYNDGAEAETLNFVCLFVVYLSLHVDAKAMR